MLTVLQVADKLGLCKARVIVFIKKGRLKASKDIKGTFQIKEEDYEVFFNEDYVKRSPAGGREAGYRKQRPIN